METTQTLDSRHGAARGGRVEDTTELGGRLDAVVRLGVGHPLDLIPAVGLLRLDLGVVKFGIVVPPGLDPRVDLHDGQRDGGQRKAGGQKKWTGGGWTMDDGWRDKMEGPYGGT